MFGAPPSASPFGTPSSSPAIGNPYSTPAFGTPGFGTPSTPSFATGFGGTFLFSTPFSQQPQQQQQTPLFQQQQQSPGGFGFSTPFDAPQAQSTPFGQPGSTPGSPFGNAQLTTQMTPVARLPFSLADRDIQALLYKS